MSKAVVWSFGRRQSFGVSVEAQDVMCSERFLYNSLLRQGRRDPYPLLKGRKQGFQLTFCLSRPYIYIYHFNTIISITAIVALVVMVVFVVFYGQHKPCFCILVKSGREIKIYPWPSNITNAFNNVSFRKIVN